MSSWSLLLLATVSGLGLQTPARPDTKADTGCQFSLMRESTPTQILAGDSITVPIRVLTQPDSPVIVTRADLRHISVTAGSSGFTQRADGTSFVDIRNISDRLVTRVDIAVQTRSRDGYAGNIITSEIPIEPDGSAHIDFRMGTGSGTVQNGVAEFVLFVESVEIAGCRYRYSQPWPFH